MYWGMGTSSVAQILSIEVPIEVETPSIEVWVYQRPYIIETMHYLCNAYLGCTYPCWQVALQSVAIANALGWLARPLVAEISCALIVHYRFSAECIVSLI